MNKILLLASLLLISPVLVAADAPKVGDDAPDFTLTSAAGQTTGQVNLAETLKKGPVVLVVLRGYPGYQCPLCTRQVAGLRKHAEDFAAKDATVLMIYPGPANGLQAKADEFVSGTTLPTPMNLLIDPDYQFTNDYGLRWNAPRETAYPATFVISSDGKVIFADISESHGGRTDPQRVVKALP